MNDKLNILWNRKWVWVGILLFAAFLFSYLQPLQFDEGGEATFLSMLVLILIGYFFGAKEAVLSVLVYSLARYVTDYHSMHNLAEFMDYMLGYGLLAVGGIVAHKTGRLKLGYCVGVLLRYMESIINCVMFYYIPTDTLWENIWEGISYSAYYIAAEFVLTMVVLAFPVVCEAIEYWKYVATHERTENLNTF